MRKKSIKSQPPNKSRQQSRKSKPGRSIKVKKAGLVKSGGGKFYQSFFASADALQAGITGTFNVFIPTLGLIQKPGKKRVPRTTVDLVGGIKKRRKRTRKELRR